MESFAWPRAIFLSNTVFRSQHEAQPGSRADLREKPRRPLTSTLDLEFMTIALIRTLVVGLSAALLMSCSTDGVEITSYPLLCDKPLASGDCQGKIIPLNRSIYKVFSSSQQVVYWTPGISDRPVRLEQCAIRDAENWKCRLPHDQGEVEFKNGNFKEVLAKPRASDDRFFYAGAARWWLHQLLLSRL